MARKQRNELSAGIFVIVALAATLGVVVWLGAADVFKPTKQRAFFYIQEGEGGGGLEAGSLVQIGGATVGKIGQVRFDAPGKRTFYVAEIEHGEVRIHADGTARLKAGLLGGAVLSVSRGSEAEPLADSETYAIEIGGGIDKALDDLAWTTERIRHELDAEQPGTVMAQVKEAVVKLNSVVSKADTIASKVDGTIDDIQEMAADAKPKMSRIMTDAAEAAAQIRQYAKEDLADILAKLRESNTQVLKIAKDFGEVSEQTKQIVLVNRDNIDEMIDNMTIVSANLKAASREIRANPWRLLHKPKPEELHAQNIHDAARAFLSGADQLDQSLAKLTGLAKAYPEGIDPKDPKFQEVRKQVLETFENFKTVEDAFWEELKPKQP